jgi:hypothetical protein
MPLFLRSFGRRPRLSFRVGRAAEEMPQELRDWSAAPRVSCQSPQLRTARHRLSRKHSRGLRLDSEVGTLIQQRQARLTLAVAFRKAIAKIR